jgi:hypothetical protein
MGLNPSLSIWESAVEFTVADTGIGISEGLMPVIFEYTISGVATTTSH